MGEFDIYGAIQLLSTIRTSLLSHLICSMALGGCPSHRFWLASYKLLDKPAKHIKLDVKLILGLDWNNSFDLENRNDPLGSCCGVGRNRADSLHTPNFKWPKAFTRARPAREQSQV